MQATQFLGTMRPNIRLWTVLTLIVICAFSVTRGVSIVHFSFAAASSNSSQDRAKSLEPWTAAAGIGSTALQALLKQPFDVSDAKVTIRRRETLSALVSVNPLSSNDWLLLSGMQLITDQPMEQVFAALRLSSMTGPNESSVMTDRGIFGVSVWEDLSPDLRRHVINDLAAGEIPESRKIRPVVDPKSAAARNELRTSLLATGLSPKEVDRRLGY
jgi:hypothetical protein